MSKPSYEYAQALYALATENECFDEYKKDLDLVLEVLLENPEYIDLISCVSIPKEERLELIDRAFSGAVSAEVLSFMKLMCEKNRIGDLKESREEYNAMLRELQGVSRAMVTSAVELSAEQKAQLEAKLEKISGKKVIAEYFVDKSILGGLMVEIDGRIMDSSLKGHLSNVKDVIK